MEENQSETMKQENLEQDNQTATEDSFFSDWPMMQERLKYEPKDKGILHKIMVTAIFCLLTYCAYRFHLYFAIVSLIGVAVSVIILIASLIKTRGAKAKLWPLFWSIFLFCVSLTSTPATLITLEDGTQVYQVNVPDGLAKIFHIEK